MRVIDMGKIEKLMCIDCGWHGNTKTVLRAPHPFSFYPMYGCPNCRDTNIHRACCEPYCFGPVSCGIPTDEGYKSYCNKHYMKYDKALPNVDKNDSALNDFKDGEK